MRKVKTYGHTKILTGVFIVVLFIIAPNDTAHIPVNRRMGIMDKCIMIYTHNRLT